METKEGTLAEKLERLFDEVRKSDGKKYTQQEVVEGTDGMLTRVYLWKLRTGRATNPGFHIIQSIADFFGVDTNYFSDDEESAAELEKTRPAHKLVEKIAARSSELDEEGMQTILNMIDYILKSKTEEPDESGEG